MSGGLPTSEATGGLMVNTEILGTCLCFRGSRYLDDYWQIIWRQAGEQVESPLTVNLMWHFRNLKM